MNNIIVIGTEPACPRCKLLTGIVSKIVESMKLEATVQHIAYTTEEAKMYAEAVGLKPGTAKDVAKQLSKEIDAQEITKAAQNTVSYQEKLDVILKPFEQLFKEVAYLDNYLRPFENKAKDVGILMTPVLIINGEIKHQVSVPDLLKIEEWLSVLKR